MTPRRYSTQGIILSRRNYSEADRIISVYTKHYGKLSYIAKGVRKTRSRKRGSLEVFSQVKFSAAKGKSIDLITEVEAIDTYGGIRKDIKKVAVAYFFMEVVDKTTQEGEKNVQLFELIVDYLEVLKTERRLGVLRKKYIFDTLVLLGFWPKSKKMFNPDRMLETVTEREMGSVNVGRKLVS